MSGFKSRNELKQMTKEEMKSWLDRYYRMSKDNLGTRTYTIITLNKRITSDSFDGLWNTLLKFVAE
jgi:hypothetical protein